jgi:hypothetical protein
MPHTVQHLIDEVAQRVIRAALALQSLEIVCHGWVWVGVSNIESSPALYRS